MIKFAFIAPSKYTELGIHESDMNMVLAHVADKDDIYAQLFKDSNKETLLDNGAFELDEPYEVSKMIEVGHKVGADILVLPDYPNEDWTKGWEGLDEAIKLYKSEGFKTMFAPQSLYGDSEGYLTSASKALKHPDIDFIGLSILGCPNAFPDLPTHKVREKILDYFEKYQNVAKRFHILGMIDDPLEEVSRLTYYKELINSWDSSAAIWAGLNNVKLELGKPKFKMPVDFDYPVKDFSVSLVLDNIEALKERR